MMTAEEVEEMTIEAFRKALKEIDYTFNPSLPHNRWNSWPWPGYPICTICGTPWTMYSKVSKKINLCWKCYEGYWQQNIPMLEYIKHRIAIKMATIK